MADRPVPPSPRITELTKRLQREPGSRVFLDLAREYHAAGIFEEAVRVCREGLEKHAAYHSARVLLGRTLIDLKRFDEACPELERVVKQAPDNLLARRLLGEAQAGAGRRDVALATLRALLLLQPGDEDTLKKISEIEEDLTPAAPPEGAESRVTVRPDEPGPGSPAEPASVGRVEAEKVAPIEAAAAPSPSVGAFAEAPAPEPRAAEAGFETLDARIEQAAPDMASEISAAAAIPMESAEIPPAGGMLRREALPEDLAAGVGFVSAEAVPEAWTGLATAPPGMPRGPAIEQPPETLRPGGTTPAPEPAPASGLPQALPTQTLAELYLMQGDAGRALDVYRDLLAANPGDAATAARVREIESSLVQAPPPSAEAHEEEPPSADALPTPTLAEIFAAQGQHERAAEIYRQVLEGDPDNHEAEARLRELVGRLGRQEALPESDSSRLRKIRALEAWLAKIRRGGDVQDHA